MSWPPVSPGTAANPAPGTGAAGGSATGAAQPPATTAASRTAYTLNARLFMMSLPIRVAQTIRLDPLQGQSVICSVIRFSAD
jgi:hypothetical protein